MNPYLTHEGTYHQPRTYHTVGKKERDAKQQDTPIDQASVGDAGYKELK